MEFIFQIAILIMSVVVHEVAHGYAANMLGDKTAEYQGRLSLNPLNHLDFIGSFIVPLVTYLTGGFIIGWAKPVPFNPYNLRNQKWGEAIVAIAGPASNLLIALIFGFAIRFSSVVSFGQGFFTMFIMITITNIALAVFNLVPIPPLDGSKILFSLLPPQSRFRESMEKNGLVLIILFIFFFSQFITPITALIFHSITGLS